MIAVADNHRLRRYEVYVDEALAGFVTYTRRRGSIVFKHTEILPPFAGRGLASEMARTALDHARRDHLEVVPACPFVRGFIERHAEYADLVHKARHSIVS